MATFIEIYNLRFNFELNARAQVALAFVAQEVLQEDPIIKDHDLRLAWANRVLIDTKGEVEKIMWGVAGDVGFQTKGQATDQELKDIVTKLVDVFLR